MPRSRLFRRHVTTPKAFSRMESTVSRAAGYGIESLEKRLLFHTIGYDAANNTLVPDGQFEYFDEKKNTVRVVWHDVVAELIGAAVDSKTDTVTQADLVPPADPAPTDGVNLFTIYITQSSLDSYISIAQVPAITAKGARNMEPFSGSVGSFSIINPGTGDPRVPFALPGGSGAILLGGTYFGPNGSPFDANQPFDTVNTIFGSDSLGVYPGSADGTLTAGVIETPTQINPATGLPTIDAATGLQTPNDLGRFFFGGTILGAVSIPSPAAGTVPAAPASQGGNVGVFYAGNILTGDPDGIISGFGTATTQIANFSVGGDIRDLVTNGLIGGGPVGNNSYLTGFDLSVGGTVGQLSLHQSNYYGTFDVQHSASVYGLPENLFAETELEFKGPNAGVIFQGVADPISGLVTYPALSVFTNDTPATPQYLGSEQVVDPFTGMPIRTADGRLTYGSFVTGTIQGGLAPADRETGADYYAVALMAGQTITVTATTSGEAQSQIIDPDGRIVASDNLLPDAPFQYTADRPGVYKIGVLDVPNVFELFDIPYTLEVDGVGDMGVGAVSTQGGGIYDGGFDTGFEVDNGDLGAMVAGSFIKSTAFGVIDQTTGVETAPRTILVADGNLRGLVAATLGITTSPAGTDAATGLSFGSIFGDGPILDVPLGSVGLLQTTDGSAAGILDVETRFDPTSFITLIPISPIGGSIQRILGASTTFLEIAADGGIGTINAGAMDTLTPSFIEVNADNKGSDGIIDMVDCQGQFGVLGGGPEFITNEGGNIRYMRCGGAVFKDTFFGGTQIIPLQHTVGQLVNITDDSGAVASYTPIGQVVTTTVLNADGTTSTLTTGPQITTMTYPIRDKGGQVTLSVVSSGGLTVSATGLSGANSSVEVGSIEIQGIGRGLTVGPQDIHHNVTLLQPVPVVVAGTFDASDLELNLNGGVSIDVLNVLVTTSVAGDEAVAINNNTPGELVGITGPGAATIFSHGNLGIATPKATPMAILPTEALLTAYPFNQQTTGINITGSVITMSADGAIGNINVTGDIQTLIANADGKTVPGVFAGIDGPIVVNTTAPTIGGRLLNVVDGQGILASGTGDMARAGLFAMGMIGFVTGSGSIRGDIISLEGSTTPAVTGGVPATNPIGIEGITLSGSASIIETFIGIDLGFNELDLIRPGLIIPAFTHNTGTLFYDLGQVSVSGTGGIIGSEIFGYFIGPITVGPKGFGVINTDVLTVFNGLVAGINAGGYGIRGCLISGGDDVGGLTANGNGSLLSVLKFPAELLVSNTPDEFDPFLGTLPTNFSDLNAALGTTLANPIIPNVTVTGVLEDTTVEGGGTLGNVTAHTVRTTLPLFSPGLPPIESPFLNLPKPGQTYAMALNFGTSVGNVSVSGPIDGLQITAGSLGDFHPSAGVSRLGISVAGMIHNITIHGNLGQIVTDPITSTLVPDSFVNATGPDGSIGSLNVTGNVNANVNANGSLGKVIIGGNVVGTFTILGQTNGLALKSFHIGGNLQNGSLIIHGNAGIIIANGSLGNIGDSLTILGNLQSLTVGAVRSIGHNLNSAVHVEGTLGKLTVYGQINAPLAVDGDLLNMQVTAIGLPGNAINSPITVGGRMGNAVVTGGDVGGNVTVNGSINSFTVARANVLFTTTIQSLIEAIHSFKITGGTAFGMYGTLLATNGLNEKVDISGNLGDGTHAANITTLSGSTFRIRGTVSNHASIAAGGPLGYLEVDGDIAAGAVVTAHPLVKLKVKGTNQGTITAI